MKNNKVHVGLIGCGGYMRFAHVPALLNTKHAVIAAVSDPQSSQIDTLLTNAGISAPGYADYREMIRNEQDLDAVVICTPHSLHYEQTRFALEHDLHTLVQKPFTIRHDHATKLIALAAKRSRFIAVAYQRFFQGQSMYARELIANGRIGEIRGVACYITQNWGTAATGWRMEPELSGGGFLMDTGSHILSAVLRITGLKPVQVSAVTENHGAKVDLSSVVSIRFENDSLCSLSFFGHALRHEECISIHGSKGCIILRAKQWKPEPLLLDGEETPVPARLKPGSPDAAFVQWIRTGGKGYAPPDTAVQTVKLAEKIYQSAREGKPVAVNLRSSRSRLLGIS